jgi:hypothetical protein
MRELVLDRIPAVGLRNVKYDENPVFTSEPKSRGVNRLAIYKWRKLRILLVAANSNDFHWLRHSQFVSYQKLAEDSAHLLKMRSNVVTGLLSCIGEDDEMIGANAKPMLVSSVGGKKGGYNENR